MEYCGRIYLRDFFAVIGGSDAVSLSALSGCSKYMAARALISSAHVLAENDLISFAEYPCPSAQAFRMNFTVWFSGVLMILVVESGEVVSSPLR
jgi:hypothetical protein